MSVDYEVLQNFVDIDDLELNYHRVTNNINSIDIEFANWDDLSTISRQIFTALFKRGVQLQLTPQGDMN